MAQRPQIPPPPHRGGCLCGAVRYTVTARPISIHACHCNDCRKLTGVAHLLMVGTARDAFAATGAVDRFTKHADSGRTLDLVRCAACGTRLWHEPHASPNLIFVAAGTLDDPSWAIPTVHIWVDKAPGAPLGEDAAMVEGQPATRDVLFDSFRRFYGDGA
ncbi:MAG TPA: GFA family protein [Rhizomicrobium sp.]